jgi:hypothetical protein
MTARAYAIAVPVRLCVDTPRTSEADAREAAIRLLKTPGVGWRDLERAGYRVVSVEVSSAPPPRPRSPGKPADLVVARARERLRTSSADGVPIRRLRGAGRGGLSRTS